MSRRRLAAVLLLPAAAVIAQDKSDYHLFNPTPTDLMREMSADRPDGTESPYTVDAGHFQLEMSFIDFVHNDDDGVETNTLTLLDANLKLGLTNNTDLQLVFSPYQHERTDPTGGPADTAEGVSDVTLRLKVNLWGNDGGAPGSTAFGVMPFIKLPSGTDVSNDHVEAGFINMLAWNVADAWGLGFMIETDAVYDEDDGDYDLELVHTAVLGFDIVDPLGAYVEYIGVVSSDSADDYQAIFSVGVTYGLSDNLQLDVGAQVGLTDSADDLNVFTGMTWRY